MIYFKKCDYSAGDDRISHKNILHEEAHRLLNRALQKKGVRAENKELIYNKYGKPMLKDNDTIHFNISHCIRLAVCALTENAIGVDAENIREYPKRVLNRCFTANEISFVRENEFPDRAFFQIWTLKESYAKAIGTGITFPLKEAEFIIGNNFIAANTERKFAFSQIIIDNEFVCSVCCDDILNNKVLFRSYEEFIPLDILQ